MSTFSRAPAAAQATAGPSWTALVRIRFKTWWATRRKRQIELAAMQQLNLMSDRDLIDIGISRSEIPHAVMHDAARDRTFGRHY